MWSAVVVLLGVRGVRRCLAAERDALLAGREPCRRSTSAWDPSNSPSRPRGQRLATLRVGKEHRRIAGQHHESHGEVEGVGAGIDSQCCSCAMGRLMDFTWKLLICLNQSPECDQFFLDQGAGFLVPSSVIVKMKNIYYAALNADIR